MGDKNFGFFEKANYEDIRIAGCQVFECSDSFGFQYPQCEHSWDYCVCPMLKFLNKVHKMEMLLKRQGNGH